MAQDNPAYPIATAAISWTDSGGQPHIRVYSTDGYNVTERCFDGESWADGAFKQPGSAVSATCWTSGGSVSLRVYCTFEDTTIEWCSDSGSSWTQGGYTTV